MRYPTRALLLFSGMQLAWAGGCGYNVGAPFPTDVRSVAVPIFQDETFRRDLGPHLTEAVLRELKTRSPFRIASESTAQTVLVGRITRVRKSSLGLTNNGDPRQIEFGMAVRVSWEETGTGRVLQRWDVPLSPSMMALQSNSTLAPEVGQSLATARQQAVQDLARQIVDRMETPWSEN